MRTVYKSKPGLGLLIPVLVLLAVIGTLMGYVKLWAGLVIVILVTGFVLDSFLRTIYIVEDQRLLIRAGLFYKLNIDILTIRKISESNDIISSPAPSIADRLEILYNKHDRVIISPSGKTKFIEQITMINPEIVVKFRKRSTYDNTDNIIGRL